MDWLVKVQLDHRVGVHEIPRISICRQYVIWLTATTSDVFTFETFLLCSSSNYCFAVDVSLFPVLLLFEQIMLRGSNRDQSILVNGFPN